MRNPGATTDFLEKKVPAPSYHPHEIRFSNSVNVDELLLPGKKQMEVKNRTEVCENSLTQHQFV